MFTKIHFSVNGINILKAIHYMASKDSIFNINTSKLIVECQTLMQLFLWEHSRADQKFESLVLTKLPK